MHKKVEQFRPFYLMYADIDTYLWWIINHYGYGEDSAFVKLIESAFLDQIVNPQKYKKTQTNCSLKSGSFYMITDLKKR